MKHIHETTAGTIFGDKRLETLVENNRKVTEHFLKISRDRVLAEAKRYGIKEADKILGKWHERFDFSIKSFREGCYAVANRKSMEAQAELAFGQLLRAGVQNTFNDLYQAAPTVYEALVKMTGSNKRQEFFAPLERAGFPKRVPTQGSFPETNFQGLDIELVNEKTGMMLAFERELIDDDQTGQITQLAGQAGENARIYEEVYVMAKLFDTEIAFDGETMAKSQTYGTVYSATGIHGTGLGINSVGNGRMSQTKLEQAYILAQKMVDRSGRPIVVMPNVLVTSAQDIFLAKVLLNSAYNPSGAAAAGVAGGAFSVNPIQNLAGVVSSRFVPDYKALLLQASKGFAFQRRDPTEVVQENPQSGPAFSQEVFRFKQRSRWVADFIDPKFGILINANGASS